MSTAVNSRTESERNISVFQSHSRNVRDGIDHDAALCVNENKLWQILAWRKTVNDIKVDKQRRVRYDPLTSSGFQRQASYLNNDLPEYQC